MKKHLLFFFLLLSIIVSACTTQCPPLTDSQKAVIEKQILEIMDKIYISIENLEVDGYVVYLSSDEFLGFQACWLKAPILTSSALADSTRAWFNQRKKHEISNVKVKVSVLSTDYILVDRTANWRISFTNGRIGNFIHTASFIFKKEVSGWKIIHLMEWLQC